MSPSPWDGRAGRWLCAPLTHREGCREVMCELQHCCPRSCCWVPMLLSAAGVQESGWCCPAQSHTIPCPHCSLSTPFPGLSATPVAGCVCQHVLQAGAVNHCSQRLYPGRRQLVKGRHRRSGRTPALSAREESAQGTVTVPALQRAPGAGGAAELHQGLDRPGEVKHQVLLCCCRKVWLQRHPGSRAQGMVPGSALPQDRAPALHS